MSTASQPTTAAVTAAYEQHLRANWDNLSPFEQEEARAYLQSKYHSASIVAAKNDAPGWTIPAGYVFCVVSILFLPVVFAPAAFGIGIYNAVKGRVGHGIAQIILSIMCGLVGMILGVLIWAA